MHRLVLLEEGHVLSDKVAATVFAGFACACAGACALSLQSRGWDGVVAADVAGHLVDDVLVRGEVLLRAEAVEAVRADEDEVLQQFADGGGFGR